MSSFGGLFEPVVNVYLWIFSLWWIWLAPTTVTLFVFTWLAWKRAIFKENIKWLLLEIRIPREIDKSPKAMEQFFASIHGLRNAPSDFIEKYIEGEVSLWFSLEFVSLEGEVHMYIRTPEKHKKFVTGYFYAHYPTVELEEVADYMEKFPGSISELYANGYNLWGSEIVLTKEDAYPIRTYLQYENMEEAMALDPIAGILEILTRLGAGENLLFQILIRPASPDWKERGEKLVMELKTKGQQKIVGPAGEYTDRPIRSPGETETLKAIEQNISKSGFETLMRYMYVSDGTVFSHDFARRSIVSALNQYAALDLNSFVRNFKVATDVKWMYFPHVFNKRRLEARKHRIYNNYRFRSMPEESGLEKIFSAHILNLNFAQRVFVLNIEELATIFHPPTKLVLTSQLLERSPSARLGPTIGLPIFEDEIKKKI
jgi:hypothetical protein